MTPEFAYRVGDKVVHPVYGAGTVVEIAQTSIAGDERSYYVIDPVTHDLRVMVPVEQATSAGLRDVLSKSGVKRVLRTLSGAPDELSDDYRERQDRIGERLKSANPFEIAEVLRNLSWLERQRGRLGSKDAQLFDRARDLLAGELAVADGTDTEHAIAQIKAALERADEADWGSLPAEQSDEA